MKRIVFVISTLLLLTACSLVKLSTAGENVAVLSLSEVSQCTLTGETTVSVLAKVGVNRKKAKVENELQTLARNWAAERGGDTVVAISDVEEGERNYNIYRCRP